MRILGKAGLHRHLLALMLKLPPPRFSVGVERSIPIEMPDSIRLLADHYRPRGAGDVPTILIRTPYGRGREAGLGNGYPLAEFPAQRFAERGYHVVVQGIRGCFDSEGQFSPHVHEAPDGQATVEWICQQPWFNGTLATWGPSYLGYAQWAVAAAAPPSLKAMLVMVASSENYSVSHPDEAFGLETRLRWSQGVHVQRKLHNRPLRARLAHRFLGNDEQKLQAAFAHLPLIEADVAAAGEPIPFYRSILTHHHPDDAFWAARDHRAAVAATAADIHLTGGWYDYYLRGLLRDYEALRSAGRTPYLTIGPWYHGQPQGLLAGLRAGLEWFEARLKGAGNPRPKPVRIYVMGAEEWRELDTFPPPTRSVLYYLHAKGGLSTELPGSDSAPDTYRYDPADPTPALGGALLGFAGVGAQDNRALEARTDVLCYTTPPLTQEIEIVGQVQLTLFAHSSLPHTDFFGRLCDVAPDGRSVNICDGLFRVAPGRGQVQSDGSLKVEIDLWATAHRFLPGHHMRLQVSSGAHPRWSRNLGTGESLATGVAMLAAEQTIHHDSAHPSALVLPISATA